ncbi:Sodium, potassium, lithium and rubidium/H(+) antiporter [Pigmentiphaga humi]|uniref:Sodium, potassium, lithium and rubidium/H(+) antiporter n=1 Tax=Pigmentiphaga humi TaxID=2478468 RepID=A0A3P4B5F5_9BURK|nr:Na+/H+ antiporter [Pigmentiphaga humi]VCU70766.1 Sodium, potassium, lithium and rubidium/H(+) antiporter [Pigmentiphaga humi]
MQIVFTVLVLLLAVAVSGVLSRVSPLRLPLPLFQIALGALLAAPAFGLKVRFDPELFLLLFIPPLLFVDGWRIPKRQLYRLRKPILALALGLVLFTVAGVGYFIHWLIPAISLPVAFALGAVLSPTDAVAVSAIVGKNRLPPALQHVLEGESLMNDASGLVAFKFAIAAVLTGTFSLWEASLSFVVIAVGGLAIGALLAWLLSLTRKMVARWTDDEPAIQVVLLVLTPFAAYLVAEHFGVSGILSAVAAGLAMTYTESGGEGSSAMRLQSNSVWSMLEFVFNGMTFILLGLQLPSVIGLAHADAREAGNVPVWHLFVYVVAITIALIVLRLIWVWVTYHLRTVRLLVQRSRVRKVNLWVLLVSSLAGVRGSITMAGVLTVPLEISEGVPFPGRDLLIFLATGVILCSLLIASSLLPLVLPKVPTPVETMKDREARKARLKLAHAAVQGLEQAQMRMQPGLSEEALVVLNEVAAGLSSIYHTRIDAESSEEAVAERANLHRNFERDLRMAAIYAQRTELYRLREQRLIDDDVFNTLLRDVDLAENWLAGPLVSKGG